MINGTLIEIMDYINGCFSLRCNSVLCNFYVNGDDYVDWHADDEDDIVPGSAIVSLSLGCERLFQMRRKRSHERPIDFILRQGSLFSMQGHTQQHFLHRVPPDGSSLPRLNLTFRHMRV